MEFYLLGTLKHERWAYENEYRLLFPIGNRNIVGQPFSMIPSSIYMGLKCDNHFKKKLIGIAKQLSCSVFEAYIDSSIIEYKISYRQIG